MRYELGPEEDFEIKTKQGGVVKVPSSAANAMLGLELTETQRANIDAVPGKADKDPVLDNTLSALFRMDTDLAECETTQDVAILKLTQLTGEDVASFPV